MADNKQLIVCVRVFKHREQTKNSTIRTVGQNVLQKIWDGSAWGEFKGKLVPWPAMERKYPGHHVFNVEAEPRSPEDEFGGVVPSRALYIVKLSDGSLHGFSKEYPTVSVCPPGATIQSPLGTGVLIDFATEKKTQRPKLDGLKESIWVQSKILPTTHIMVKIRLNREFNHVVCKDDVTGEAFPYVLSQVVVLSAKADL